MAQNSHVSIKNVLFVCLGNICRSPIAEGIFRHITTQRGYGNQFKIGSAGLGSWHIGRPPDIRAQEAVREFGIDISNLRARRVSPSDFESYDLILAMDRANRNGLLRMAPVQFRDKIQLFLSYAPNMSVREVPDPFFGNADNFDYVCQLVDAACRGLLVSLTSQTQLQKTPAANSGVVLSENGYSASTT
ncbi:MAG: low molecular weight phosphotyrosine protein phosphatase [Hyphomicrobiales bacterium]|nr:low molecular weight phosphotyrosine protein phosphatase [Hyphomicrobiales bacterium]